MIYNARLIFILEDIFKLNMESLIRNLIGWN
jgi:hypothetical protein